MTFSLRVALSLALLGTTITGCGEGDDARNEAMIFLTRYDDFATDAPREDRERGVAELRGLVLSNESVRAVRDACADAFDSVLRAEGQHTEATRMLLEASNGGAGEIPTEAAARIEAAIQESTEAIEASRTGFQRCQTGVQTLRTRFAGQRASHR
jgi:hypothetical protein